MNRAVAIAAAVAVVTCGCALFSRGEALSVRYFSPASTSARLGSTSPQPPRRALRLGRVRGAQYLRERIAYRESPYEVGFYDGREWTERPEAYVRRALERKLFEERGLERVTAGPALSLEVEVLAFEELRTPQVHGARVTLRYEIRDDQAVLEERTIAVDRAVPGPRFEDVVAAISGALEEVADRIADRIVEVAAPGPLPAGSGVPH